MTTKLEINVRTLLSHCEGLAKSNDDANSWRIKKYIKSLDTMIKELEVTESQLNATEIDAYYSRMSKLKQATNYTDTSPPTSRRKLKSKSKDSFENGIDESGDSIVREINQIKTSNYQNELRKDLLGGESTTKDQSLRKRINASGSGQSMGQAMKYYGDMQERIAEDMLTMTRNLKEQTQTANRIIRNDTDIVSSSAKLTDKNFSSLTQEADKLQEHSRRAWKCWMWLMIGLVMMIFIGMVLFMKVMKKRTI